MLATDSRRSIMRYALCYNTLALIRARNGDLYRILSAFYDLSQYTRSRKCDIIKRVRTLCSFSLSPSPYSRYSGYALAAGHLQDAGEYTRQTSAGAAAGEPADSSCRPRARTQDEERWQLLVFLQVLTAFFLRPTVTFCESSLMLSVLQFLSTASAIQDK